MQTLQDRPALRADLIRVGYEAGNFADRLEPFQLDEATFRKIVLVLLLASGAALIV